MHSDNIIPNSFYFYVLYSFGIISQTLSIILYRECFIAEKLYSSGLYCKSITIVIYDRYDSYL